MKKEEFDLPDVLITQDVAILIDGNNIERSIQEMTGERGAMVNFDVLIPKLLDGRGLTRLIYFREGADISSKLAERLYNHYHGSVYPCYKSADIPLSIKATQIASKVDTILILSGDSDFIELVRHLKNEGVRVEIAAVPHSTAEILKREADHFTVIGKDDIYILKSAGKSKGTRQAPRGKSAKKTNRKPANKK